MEWYRLDLNHKTKPEIMIIRTQGYKVGEQFFPTIEEAQKAELIAALGETELGCANAVVADAIMLKRDAIICILTTTAKSRPSARKQNGAVRKTRKPKSVVAQFNEGVAKAAGEMRQRIADGKGVQ